MPLVNLKRNETPNMESITKESEFDNTDYHVEDDEFEMEEDKRRILKDLIEKYSSFKSLKDQDQLTSLSEILLEFELEKWLLQKRQLIEQRTSNNIKKEGKKVITSIKDLECDYQEYRKRRVKKINDISIKPTLKYPESKSKAYIEEVIITFTSLLILRINITFFQD